MSTRIPYFFWDENSGRVCGFSIISPDNWSQQQAHLYSSRPANKLTMVPIVDAEFLANLRLNGPQNYVMTDAVPTLLPPDQRNLTPQFLVSTDDQLMSLNAKMDQQLDLTKQMLTALTAMTKAVA